MKQTLPIGVLIVALALGIGYNFIHLPNKRQVNLIRKQIAQELANQQTQAEVSTLLKRTEEFRKRLPDEPDPSWLARAAVALAQTVGVQLTTINQELPQEFEQFTRLAISLQFSASYHELGTLLDAIERSDQFMCVERVRVGHSTTGDHVTIEVVLSTIYLKPVVKGDMQVAEANR